ncbi:MAG TPA: matrixin family metalloprotease [Gemmatimonadales bacterium]|nr:matrixin family metalloprotease [Gemmatimonadales bacterium]
MISLRGHRATVLACLAGGAAVALAFACHETGGPAACFEPNATAYAYFLNGDTNLVFHWPASYMPVRVYAEPTGSLPANVQTAMALWTGAFRCHELSLTATTDSTHADVIFRNPLSAPEAPPAARVMHVDSIGSCHGLTQFFTDSDTVALVGPMRSYVVAYPGVDSASAAACFRIATTHELGHALGLLAESPDGGDIMYSTPSRSTLSEDDRFTIQLLYHATSKLAPPPRQ